MSEPRSPLAELIVARLKEFLREPAAIFWVYGFPVLMMFGLGLAFRSSAPQPAVVDVVDGPAGRRVAAVLEEAGGFAAALHDRAAGDARRRRGSADLLVEAADSSAVPAVRFFYDDTRPESVRAAALVDDALQRAAGRRDPLEVSRVLVAEPGARYIDFLVPGLLGMGVMGGGLWGVGFFIVDLRKRKLMKRFLATPMRRTDFLISVMVSRLAFMVPEMVLILLSARLVFGVAIHGSLVAVVFVILLGTFAFSGVGLLVACRAQTTETVSGLMNLVMLPMWILSGIFFSAERFPEAAQPFIQALPLTALIDALRALMNHGATLASQWHEVADLAVWCVGSFAAALAAFRWK